MSGAVAAFYLVGFFQGNNSARFPESNYNVTKAKETVESDCEKDVNNPSQANSGEAPSMEPLHLGRRDALTELRAALPNFTTLDFSSKLQNLLASKDTFSNRTLASELIEAWAERFPEEARAFVMTKAKTTGRGKELNYYHKEALVEGLLANAPEATLRWLEALPEGERDLSLYANAIGKVSQTDPELAYRFATETESGNKAWFLNEFFNSTVQRDPSLAITYLSKVDERINKVDLVSGIVNEWLKLDPSASLSWASKLSNSKERERALSTYFSSLNKIAPKEAFESRKEFVIAEDKPEAQYMIGYDIFSGLSSMDADLAIQWVRENLSDSYFRQIERGYLFKMSQTDPEGTIKRILNDDVSHSQQASLLPQALKVWMQRDSPSCLQWLQEHTADMAPDDLERLVSGYQGSQEVPPFEALWQAAKLFPEGEMQRRSTKELVAQWVTEDRTACLQALETLPEGPERDALYGATLIGLAKLDPDAAFAEITKQPEGKEREEMVKGLADSMAWKDSEKAVRLLQEHKILNEDNFNEAFKEWGKRAPSEAAQWLTQLSDGPVKQKAISTLAGQLSEKSPQKAIQWAMQLQAPEQQGAALINAAKAWIARDSEAGYAWVERSPLEAEDKAAFMKRRAK